MVGDLGAQGGEFGGDAACHAGEGFVEEGFEGGGAGADLANKG